MGLSRFKNGIYKNRRETPSTVSVLFSYFSANTKTSLPLYQLVRCDTVDGTRLGGDRGRRSNALLAVVFGAEEMNKVFLVEGWGLR